MKHWLWLFIAFLIVASNGLVAIPAHAQTGGCSTTYTVQRGDTLYRIALRFNTTLGDLQARNNIQNPNRIFAGQQLCISGGSLPPPDTSWNNLGTVTAYRLNIRTGPSTDYPRVRRAVRGESLRVVGRTADNRWFQIVDNPGDGVFRWAYAYYVSGVNPANVPVVGAVPYSANVLVITRGVIYNGPGTAYSSNGGYVSPNTSVLVIGRNADATWFQIRTDQGTGWVADVFPNAVARYEFPITG